MCLCSFLPAASAQAQPNVTRMWFTPSVVPEDYTLPVLFEATVTGAPATVVFEYDGIDRPMYNDGSHGDRTAGDGTWTITFQPGDIISKLTAQWVFRPFIGYCKPAGGGRFNIFGEVWSPSIGMANVQSIDATTQQTDYVVNQVVSTAQLLNPNYQQLAQRFYASHDDRFDFLNFVLIAGTRGNRFHATVKNAVSGLGAALVDGAAQYGSGGRLKGFNVFPLSSAFDTASNGFIHEIGHQWINFLSGTALASGIPHWPRGDIAINVMGASIAGSNVGGSYSWTFTPNGSGGYVVSFNQAPNANTSTFNTMELYLMGLIPAGDVGAFFVLNNQNLNVTHGQVLQPSEITPVTVGDVVAVVGPRVPDSNSSPRAFRVATIILTEQLLDLKAMSFYDWFTRRAEQTQDLACAEGFATYTCKPFYAATGGRATMTSRLTDAGPDMTLDKTTLRFGAVSNGTTLVLQTAPQVVRLTQSGAGTVTWTATPSQPWLQVTPASGTGSANLSISVVSAGGLPAVGTVSGAVTVSFSGAATSVGSVAVSLTSVLNGNSANPFGNVDTPTDNRTGVTGAVPFTGWALDDIDVARVSVCRAAFGAEVAPVDPNCGGVAQIFVGFAVFIDGARPDVAAAFPTYPANSKAGWGFMVLTNTLPSQGNGTYVFHVWARDREGHAVRLGGRTMTCANASATLPFGAIDTPEQGGVASGAMYVNFGWALTPLPKTIPIDGSTISVLVDGVTLGPPTYNNFRSDIAGLFPGLNNTNGAVGFRLLDTTTLSNGIHTIVWVVSDDVGATEGIGSRFFTVSNGASAVTAAQTARPGSHTSRNLETLPLDNTPLLGRRGWNLAAPLQTFEMRTPGRAVIRGEEVGRVELQLGYGLPASHEAFLRTSEGLKALPVGANLDATTGVFTWTPGVGFVGAYDLVFVRSAGGEPASRREVRIILQPKASGSVGPQVVIDTPRQQQHVGQPFVVGGWAADLDASQGTGISTIHAWAYPLAGGPPVFLGATASGGVRPDVAATHGTQFEASGFEVQVQGLAPGHYDLAVFAWSTERASFVTSRGVRVTVRP